MPTTSASTAFPVGLEQGPDGAVLVHSFSVPGCVSFGRDRDQALHSFPAALSEWLAFLGALGEPVPGPDLELEIVVEEWITTGADISCGESDVCFANDRRPLGDEAVACALRRLGGLRGPLLARIRGIPEAALERRRGSEWPARRILDELARAEWWTLSRLGASPMAEVPDRIVARLDTAMALIVQHVGNLDPDARDRLVELEGEEWTPRKVVRRLLWLEWALGRAALIALAEDGDLE